MVLMFSIHLQKGWGRNGFFMGTTMKTTWELSALKSGLLDWDFANVWFGIKRCSNIPDGGNDDLAQNSLKARASRNLLIISAEAVSHNHFPTTRPEKRFSPLICAPLRGRIPSGLACGSRLVCCASRNPGTGRG
jgi:hypothetical protein